MPQTVKIYPLDGAQMYWQDGSYTSSSPFTRARAGHTGTPHDYWWPIHFNLATQLAAKGLDPDAMVVSGMKFKAKIDAASNSFSAGEYLGVGYTTADATASNANCQNPVRIDPGNEHTPPGGVATTVWDEWNIMTAWNTMKANAAYLVMYGNEYGVLYDNYSTVAVSDRPYIEITYEMGVVGIHKSDGNHKVQIRQHKSDGEHLIQLRIHKSDGEHLIGV